MTFGVDRKHALTVGFEMDRRPGHDSRGFLVSRTLPEDREQDRSVYVEFGEPQQHCMEGGIEQVKSEPGFLQVRFTETGARIMAGFRIIEIEYDTTAPQTPEVLDALDDIFRGLDEYTGKPNQG
jgi:hypothetical protein